MSDAARVGLGSRPVADLMDGTFYAEDPYPAWAWMREHEPVFRDHDNRLWALTRYADVRAASLDPLTFSSAEGTRPKFWALPMMIDTDPPVHTRRRKLVSSGFTPRRIAELRAHVEKVCDDLLDAVCDRGRCDVVADLAAPLPLIVIGDLLGVAPQDRPHLLRWSDDMLRSQGDPDPAGYEGATRAFEEYTAYLGPVIAERRRTGRTDDLVGILAHAEVDGERLTDDDLVFETLLILIGGDETTRHVISGGVAALLAHPAQLDELRVDRSLMPTAVEEMLRWVSPIQNMNRTVVRDTVVAGVPLTEGDQVLLMYPSANRDPAVFDRPDEFDIRRNPNPHLAFGVGGHFCLGNQLARLEVATMLGRVLDRLTGLSATSAQPPKHPSNFVCGPTALPVTFRGARR